MRTPRSRSRSSKACPKDHSELKELHLTLIEQKGLCFVFLSAFKFNTKCIVPKAPSNRIRKQRKCEKYLNQSSKKSSPRLSLEMHFA